MCGFTGYIDLKDQKGADRAILERMADTLFHRGPDSDGYFIEGPVGFGFRRLSIIDLETGNQPIFNEDQSILLMCNGEIYNYRALRDELIAKGHRFRTNSDVEVVLHLYEEEGTGFISRLNGQFAFLIHDRAKRRTILARDHFGICPLYYTVAGQTFVLGSEIKAILQHPDLDVRVDMTGLDQILSFPGLVSPRTMFQNVKSLAPGHFLVLEEGKHQVHQYWDLDYPLEQDHTNGLSEAALVDRLDELLTQAIRYRLQADVPVGYYLSGGLDSSLVAAMGFALRGGKAPTFSISFEDKDICESSFQRMMAEKLGSNHHELRFDWSRISESLSKMVWHCECPVKETYNTCAMALSGMAHDNDITVVLAGQGADEVFAGYMGYRYDKVRGNEEIDPFDMDELMERELRQKLWGDENLFYEKDQFTYRDLKTAIYSETAAHSFPDFDCLKFPLVNQEMLAGRHPVHQRSYLDFKLRLADHLLTDHGDRMVLMHSVEGRYPFLDQDLVTFARRLPPDYKLNEYSEKYLLKKVAERYLPPEIINREKYGFRAPASPYLLQQNLPWVNDMLSYARIKRQGFFNPDTVEHLKNDYRKRSKPFNPHIETDFLMVILTFGIMLDHFSLPDL